MASLVIGSAFHNGPSVFVLISAVVYQIDGVARPTDRSPGVSLGLPGIAIGRVLIDG
jgi:hypothetical protein